MNKSVPSNVWACGAKFILLNAFMNEYFKIFML